MTQAIEVRSRSNSISLMQSHHKTQLHKQNSFSLLPTLQVCIAKNLGVVEMQCSTFFSHAYYLHLLYIYGRELIRHTGMHTLSSHDHLVQTVQLSRSIKTTPTYHTATSAAGCCSGYEWNALCWLQHKCQDHFAHSCCPSNIKCWDHFLTHCCSPSNIKCLDQ